MADPKDMKKPVPSDAHDQKKQVPQQEKTDKWAKKPDQQHTKEKPRK
jgi:hypothetical protein